MGKWIGRYNIERDPYSKEDTYINNKEISYITKDHRIITIKPGFITDGASIPKVLRWYASPFAGPWAPASLIHDGLYKLHETTRAYADKVFRDSMVDSGVRASKAWSMWLALRLGGWWSWYLHGLKDNIKQLSNFVNFSVYTRGAHKWH